MKSGNGGKRAGFNLIELLVSMAVMSVGTAALFALQGYVARSNMTSKEMTIATSIAENWVERIKTDALNWTEEGTVGAPGDKLINTGYLLDINNAADAWRIPLTTYSNALYGHAPGADLTGTEISPWPPTDASTIGFCTSLRFNWVIPGSVVRVDIRVIWPKRPSAAVFTTDYPFCSCDNGSGLDTDGNGVDDYHAVYTSTLVRWTPIAT